VTNPFIPEFEGDLELVRVPDDFVTRIRKRVEGGLLQPGNRRRANYAVRSSGRDEIEFSAEDLLTAYSIGLNDVRVERRNPNVIHYHVTFWRWVRIAVTHGLILAIGLLVCAAVLPTFRRQVESYPQGYPVLVGMVVFWCVLWPWILTAIHRRSAEGTLRRILQDTMS